MGKLIGSMAQAFAAMLLILSVAACDGPLWKREHSFRYRMTVEIETPAGIRVGSSVREVTIVENPVWAITARDATTRFQGEAVAVDLPGGRTLFTLLDRPTEYSTHLPLRLFRDQLERADPITDRDRQRVNFARRVRLLNDQKPSAIVPADRLPAFVYFTDIRDPLTVRRANPANFESSLGQGVRLARVTIEITDEPISNVIRARLPWFETLGRPSLIPLNTRRPDRVDVLGILRSSFRRES